MSKEILQKKSSLQQSVEQVISACFPGDYRLNRVETLMAEQDEIEHALDLLAVNPAKPIIIFTFKKLIKVMENSPKLAQLLKFPNVRATLGYEFQENAETFYTQPKPELDKETSELALSMILSQIRHNLGHALNGNPRFSKESLLMQARKEAGLNGSDDELVSQIMMPRSSIEVNEYFDLNAACIDYEGTLIKDGVFSLDQLMQAKEEAAKRNLPLIIWTGSNPNDVYQKLESLGIDDIDVCSKQDCKGLRAKLAIDDTDLKNLTKEFGLDAAEFIKIN